MRRIWPRLNYIEKSVYYAENIEIKSYINNAHLFVSKTTRTKKIIEKTQSHTL